MSDKTIKLTPEQEKIAEVKRDEIEDARIRAGETNKEKVNAAVTNVYRHLEWTEPNPVWLAGPEEMFIGGALISHIWDNHFEKFKAVPSAQLPSAELPEAARFDHETNVLGSLVKVALTLLPQLAAFEAKDTVASRKFKEHMTDGRSAHQTAESLLAAAIDDFMKNPESLVSEAREQLGNTVYWTWWSAAWAEFYIYLTRFDDEELPADELQKLQDWADASSESVWIPYEDIPVMSERHIAIHLDEEKMLHSSGTPTWAWADGTQLFCWHNMLVPEWVVMNPTAEKIARETNSEFRRCAIENLGWPKYLEEINAECIDTAQDPGNPSQVLELYKSPIQFFSTDVNILVMNNASLDRDGSRRKFAETVPAEITTAIGAAAWQFDVTEEVYLQMARAT